MKTMTTNPNEEPYIECGVGWQALYRPLLDLCNLYGVRALQVKEKFGGLRFYTDRVDERLDLLISAAEQQSYKTCENCGNHKWGEVTTEGRWIKSLCLTCRKARDFAYWMDNYQWKWSQALKRIEAEQEGVRVD